MSSRCVYTFAKKIADHCHKQEVKLFLSFINFIETAIKKLSDV